MAGLGEGVSSGFATISTSGGGALTGSGWGSSVAWALLTSSTPPTPPAPPPTPPLPPTPPRPSRTQRQIFIARPQVGSARASSQWPTLVETTGHEVRDVPVSELAERAARDSERADVRGWAVTYAERSSSERDLAERLLDSVRGAAPIQKRDDSSASVLLAAGYTASGLFASIVGHEYSDGRRHVLVAVWTGESWQYADATVDVPFGAALPFAREEFARVPKIPEPQRLASPVSRGEAPAYSTRAQQAIEEAMVATLGQLSKPRGTPTWVPIAAVAIVIIALAVVVAASNEDKTGEKDSV